MLDVLAAELLCGGLRPASVSDRAETLVGTVQRECISYPYDSHSWEIEHPSILVPTLLVAEWSLGEDPPDYDQDAGDEWKPVIRTVRRFVLEASRETSA